MTPSERIKHLKHAAAEIQDVVESLDNRATVCGECKHSNYLNWPEHRRVQELSGIVVKLLGIVKKLQEEGGLRG